MAIGMVGLPAAAAAAPCPNEELRALQGAQHLPDCRAWEMVSPASGDGDVHPPTGTTVAAEDGGAVKFEKQAGTDATAGQGLSSAYVSRRTTAGWLTRGLSPAVPVDPFGSTQPDGFLAFSGDLSVGLLRSFAPLAPNAVQGESNLYVQDTSGGASRLLTAPALDPFPPLLDSFLNPATYSGGSSDFETTFFESPKQMLPEAISGVPNLYERGADGSLRLVGVLPGGDVAPGGAGAGTGSAGSFVKVQRPIAEDGQHVFFTTPSNAYGLAEGEIYRRSGSTTVEVSRSGLSTDPNGPLPAQFAAAAADGSKAIFTSSEKLTPDATTGPTGAGRDLYLWSEGANPELVDLTPHTDVADPDGASVQGVLGTSENLDYIYFAAAGKLAGGATSGGSNVYLWHDGVITYVGDGAPASNWSLSPGSPTLGGGVGDRKSRVTADGEKLLFVSTAPLTGYDNAGTEQLYLFDAAGAGALECVSCRPGGAAPSGNASFVAGFPAAGRIPAPGYMPRPWSGGGRRVFFHSPDRLVAADANSKMDVYQWEDGELSLLSGGTSDDDSYFVDASVGGDDVFFTTYQRLVGTDRDFYRGLYDARVGGGLASQHPNPSPERCAGDACRPVGSEPDRAAAGTLAFGREAGRQPGGRRVPLTVSVSKLKAAVVGAQARLRVRVPAAGRITVTGSRVRGRPVVAGRGATYRLTISLRSRFARVLRDRGKLTVRAKVTFRQRGGGQVSRTVAIRFKPPAPANRQADRS